MTVGGSDARWATSDLINERLDFKFLRDPALRGHSSVIAITVESYAPMKQNPRSRRHKAFVTRGHARLLDT